VEGATPLLDQIRDGRIREGRHAPAHALERGREREDRGEATGGAIVAGRGERWAM
jgi:hypothetical protein